MHVGIRGADRAIAVCDHAARSCCRRCWRCRRTRRSSTARTPACTRYGREIFTRTFPRCGVPEPFGDWRTYADFIDLLTRRPADRRVDAAVVERAPPPRLRHGRAADLRRADARGRGVQPRRADRPPASPSRRSTTTTACSPAPLRQREIEENLWQAIRFGLDGTQIDFGSRTRDRDRGGARAARSSGPRRPATALGLELELPTENGAQRRATALEEGASLADVYREDVAETAATYAPAAAG